jgi:hemerythrin-like domain-containing protein
VLDCFEVALARSHESGNMSAGEFAPFVEFFRGFADQCHHCKEEDRLFPQLEKQGVPRDGGPIGCMLYEHKLGRAHIKALDEAVNALDAADGNDDNATQQIHAQGEAYIDLLRNHIAKEDMVLFVMADEMVQGTELTQLTNAYAEAESTPEYTSTMRRCHAIAERLIETYAPTSA